MDIYADRPWRTRMRLRTISAGIQQIVFTTSGAFGAVADTANGPPAMALQAGEAIFAVNQFSADAQAPELAFGKSRHATVGSHTIVQSGDALGDLRFYGSTGSTYASAAMIRAEVDGTPGSGTDMPGRIVLFTTPDGSASLSERMRVQQTGKIIFTAAGTVVAVPTIGGNTPEYAFWSNSGQLWTTFDQYANNNAGPHIFLRKSRSGTLGTLTIVQDGDQLGAINAYGANGSGYDVAAAIHFYVDGTPGSSNDMPGRILFYTTPNGSSSAVERWRIPQGGQFHNYGTASLPSFSGTTPWLQITTNDGNAVGITRFQNTATSPAFIAMGFSRNGTVGSHTAVSSGDWLAGIGAYGSDGTDFELAGYTAWHVDGTPGNGDMPGRWSVHCSADGSVSPTERFRVHSAATGRITGAQVQHTNGSLNDVGIMLRPFELFTTAQTIAASWAGTYKQSAAAGAVAFTTPASSDTSCPVGFWFHLINSGPAMTLVGGSSVSIYGLSGAAVLGPGTRTLATGCSVIVYKKDSTTWYVTGTGIT